MSITYNGNEPVDNDVEGHGVQINSNEAADNDVDGHGMQINASEAVDEDRGDTLSRRRAQSGMPVRRNQSQAIRYGGIGTMGNENIEDTEGHANSWNANEPVAEDDDTEGHVGFQHNEPVAEDDEDTEGHGRSLQHNESVDEDTEA